MHKALHPRDDVDRVYVSRKEGGRGLASTEDSVDAKNTTTSRLHKKSAEEKLIRATRKIQTA